LKKPLQSILLVGFLFISHAFLCQEKEEVKSIKVKKEKLFSKAAFDETNYKVIAFDRYGNPHEQAIKSFCISYAEGKNVYEAAVTGNTFPEKTIKFFTKTRSSATKICLTKLKAQDSEGHIEDLPDLCDIVLFPDCKKVNKH
jgi:hypothetical protein